LRLAHLEKVEHVEGGAALRLGVRVAHAEARVLARPHGHDALELACSAAGQFSGLGRVPSSAQLTQLGPLRQRRVADTPAVELGDAAQELAVRLARTGVQVHLLQFRPVGRLGLFRRSSTRLQTSRCTSTQARNPRSLVHRRRRRLAGQCGSLQVAAEAAHPKRPLAGQVLLLLRRRRLIDHDSIVLQNVLFTLKVDQLLVVLKQTWYIHVNLCAIQRRRTSSSGSILKSLSCSSSVPSFRNSIIFSAAMRLAIFLVLDVPLMQPMVCQAIFGTWAFTCSLVDAQLNLHDKGLVVRHAALLDHVVLGRGPVALAAQLEQLADGV